MSKEQPKTLGEWYVTEARETIPQQLGTVFCLLSLDKDKKQDNQVMSEFSNLAGKSERLWLLLHISV